MNQFLGSKASCFHSFARSIPFTPRILQSAEIYKFFKLKKDFQVEDVKRVCHCIVLLAIQEANAGEHQYPCDLSVNHFDWIQLERIRPVNEREKHEAQANKLGASLEFGDDKNVRVHFKKAESQAYTFDNVLWSPSTKQVDLFAF